MFDASMEQYVHSRARKRADQRRCCGFAQVGRRLVAGELLFAGVDGALSAELRQKMPGAWLVPVLAGAVAVGYNLPSGTGASLRIPREALAAIFLGRMQRWSELAEWNPTLANVTEPISLVVRSDVSATSAAISEALSSVSDEWRTKVGTSSRPNWPRAGFRVEGDAAVAWHVLAAPYSLGCLSLSEAAAYGVQAAHVRNVAGSFVAPTVAGVQAAMDAFASELRDAPGPNGTLHRSIVDSRCARDGIRLCLREVVFT
jgi:phosphate transport system substrate-binding protein